MVDHSSLVPAVCQFATWEPLLRLFRDSGAQEQAAAPAIRVAGRISRESWRLPLRRRLRESGRAAAVEDMLRDETEAAERVQRALADAGVDTVSFTGKIAPDGKAVLRLLGPSPAVEPGSGQPGTLLLVEGALPQPWRRLPDPMPEAVPAPSADAALLERTLRERLPDAIGATEAEIAAAEARLGVPLPEELKVLYRVARPWPEGPATDDEASERACEAVDCELFALDDLYVADASSRPCPWMFAAKEAAVTPPDAAVQGLVGSPGWIAFGDNGGGDRLAVDLTPGPRGHAGQIILLSHEEYVGASLVADSLTDLVRGQDSTQHHDGDGGRPPAVAHVNIRSLPSVQAAAHPGLEVLSIGLWDAEPLSLAPVATLPRLRTLAAHPGTLADPLEIGELTALEFLEIGPAEWRVLLDAGAVPRSLSAAAIKVRGDEDPLPIVAVANEILSLWDRPHIIQHRLAGTLGPMR